jgi:tetratricopeptide (TPR) repeat protein
MFYCKTSTNYNKWEVFESDESTDDDKEPIVPKDDP